MKIYNTMTKLVDEEVIRVAYLKIRQIKRFCKQFIIGNKIVKLIEELKLLYLLT